MAAESVPSPDLSEYFRNSVDLLSVYQIGGKFGVLNPSWQRVLGWSPQDLEGHDFIDFVHPDDVKATIDENRAEWSDDSLTRAGFENRLRTRDGTYRWFEWTSQRRGDLIYATGRDVTLRKATFAELAANVEMTKAIFAAAADLIVIVNRDLVIARNSPRGQDFFGYGDDLAVGRQCLYADASGRPAGRRGRPRANVRREYRRDRHPPVPRAARGRPLDGGGVSGSHPGRGRRPGDPSGLHRA